MSSASIGVSRPPATGCARLPTSGPRSRCTASGGPCGTTPVTLGWCPSGRGRSSWMSPSSRRLGSVPQTLWIRTEPSDRVAHARSTRRTHPSGCRLRRGLMPSDDPALGAVSPSRAREVALARRERGHEAWAVRLLGDIEAHPDRFDAESGEALYREALALAEPRGMRPLVAYCHLGLGKLYRRTGKREQAQEHLASATAMYREMGMT